MRILIIDDDITVRGTLLAQAFPGNVFFAMSPDQVTFALRHHGPFDVVFVDNDMIHWEGKDIAASHGEDILFRVKTEGMIVVWSRNSVANQEIVARFRDHMDRVKDDVTLDVSIFSRPFLGDEVTWLKELV